MQGSTLAFSVVLGWLATYGGSNRPAQLLRSPNLRCDCYEAAPLKIAPALLSTMRESMRWTARHTTKSLENFSS